MSSRRYSTMVDEPLANWPVSMGIIVRILRPRYGPPFGPFLLSDEVSDNTGRIIGPLAYFVAAKVLKSRANGPVHVVILASKAILSTISQRIEFITPMAVEIEPFCRRGWVEG